MNVDLFDFELPRALIAERPAVPRDKARLLRVCKGGLADAEVLDLPGFLAPGDVLVVNDTRVIPARLRGHRGEAKVEATLHRRLSGDCWQAFARPAKKLKVGEMSNALATLVTDQFVINGKDDKHFKLANPELNVETLKVESEAAAAGGSGKQGAPPPLPSGGGGPGKAVAEAKKRPAKDEEEQEPDPDGEAISLFPADDDAEGLIGAAASGAGVVGDDDDDGRSAQSKQASLQQKHKSKKSKKDH